MVQSNRAEFPPKVVATLAQRAAYRCSFPGCDQVTVGPDLTDSQSVTTGIAAHIFSAGDGPRGTGALSFEQRQRVENGIWLCSNHAGRIDKNDGIDFPASLLRSYKRLHEEKIIRERDGLSTGTGWVHSLHVERGPVFRTPMQIEFGKVTILVGGNRSGKTAICDWLQGISDPSVVCEWSGSTNCPSLTFEVVYLDPGKHNIRVHVPSRDEIAYFVDGDPVPLPEHPIRFIRLTDFRDHFTLGSRPPKIPDLEFLSETLRVHPALVRNILPLVSGQRGGTVARLQLEANEDGSVQVATEVQGTFAGLTRGQLSNSERCQVLIEVAVVLARYSARRAPTILILDWETKSLDSRWLRRMTEFLSSEENPFQTILERLEVDEGIRSLARVVRFAGREKDVVVASADQA